MVISVVGRIMLYTTFVPFLGFSVLAFSQFVPTAFFGRLMELAMGITLVADFTLLPVLLGWSLKPGSPASAGRS